MSELTPPSFIVLLRAELVRGAARRQARTRPRAVGLAVVLAGIAALALIRPVPATADVRVERRGDRLVVALTDLEHRPSHIEAVLRGVGLDASVVAAPVGPSEVGRFVGAVDGAVLAAEVRRLDPGPASFAGFSVPLGWAGRLELQVGRPADPGEAYAAFSDALAPGEPLACRPLLGLTATELARRLEGVPLDVLVQPGPDRPLSRSVPSAGPEAGVVQAVHATGPQQVIVRLGPAAPAPPSATARECPA